MHDVAYLWAKLDRLTFFVIFRLAFVLVTLLAAEIWRTHSFQVDFLLAAATWVSTNLSLWSIWLHTKLTGSGRICPLYEDTKGINWKPYCSAFERCLWSFCPNLVIKGCKGLSCKRLEDQSTLVTATSIIYYHLSTTAMRVTQQDTWPSILYCRDQSVTHHHHKH